MGVLRPIPTAGHLTGQRMHPLSLVGPLLFDGLVTAHPLGEMAGVALVRRLLPGCVERRSGPGGVRAWVWVNVGGWVVEREWE